MVVSEVKKKLKVEKNRLKVENKIFVFSTFVCYNNFRVMIMKKSFKKNLIVHKPNQLIEIEGQPITTQGLLAYNYLLLKFQSEKTDRMIISLNEIFNSLNVTDSYSDVFNYLDSLQKIRVVSKDVKGKVWGAFNLLSEFKKVEENEGIFIQIPHTIFSALCGTEEEKNLYYTTIELLEQKVFNCSYSIIFYEIFRKYEKVNLPCYLLKDLKKITKTEEKYKEYKDFKRYVLKNAINEINKYDNYYDYSFKEIRLSRKVNEIQFIRTEKNKKKNIKDEIIDAEIVEENTMSERLLKAIKKAKKSMYISKVYSDKAMKKLLVKYNESLIIRALEESTKYNQEINSFSSFITAKVEDIKNSSNEVIERKLEELNKNVTPASKEKKEIIEDNIADIFYKKDDEVEELKTLLLQKIKKNEELPFIIESTIKACKTKKDIEIITKNFKIEL